MWSFIRQLFIWFDVVVYGFVESIFQVIVDLANIQLFNDTVIDEFASRLYIILGLVMLFKIMISFVQMLINPDKMDDKEQGVTSLLKRVVISLALIVLVPSIFDLARQVQTELLPVIPKVVLGVESDLTSEDSEAMNSVGRVMSFYTFLAFFNYDNQDCDDGSIIGTGSRLDIEHQFQQPATIVSVGTAADHVLDRCPASTDANGYRYKYNVLLSTLVGAYLLFVLVQIAVKIAIRTLKLGICEFVAPIPIASYIDPKMSKQTFDTWVNTCWKTYLDLFIRLIIVYFMIFVFQTVLTNDFLTALYGKLGGSIIRGSLVTVFIIVGVLQFAKEAPKFIGDMLGLKADGDLMGMFKGEGWKALGSSLGGAAGMLVNPLRAATTNYNNSKLMNETPGRRVSRVLGGFIAGAGRSTVAAFNGKGWAGTRQAQTRTNENAFRKMNTLHYRYEDKLRYREQIAEYDKKEKQLYDNYNNFLRSNPSATQSEIQAERNKLNDSLKKLRESRKANPIVAPAGSIRSRMSDAYHSFTGIPMPTSKSYHEAAGLLNSGKSQIFSEAKSKVAEKPALVDDVIGFKDDSGKTYGTGTFAEVFNAYKDLTEGRKVTGKFAGVSRSDLESIYGNAWKDAAAHYVDHVYRGDNDNISNVKMKQNIEQWVFKYNSNTVVDQADRRTIDEKIAKGYGTLFKSSDDLGAKFETKAMQLETTEKAKATEKK